MRFWEWLGKNAPQIQSLTEMAAVAVGAAVGWVAWRQTQAAEAQTRAADKQTVAAEQQTAAAEAQVKAAMQQIDASLLIAEKQTTAIIQVKVATLNGAPAGDAIEFQNVGNGVALNISVRYQDDLPGYDDLRLSKMILAPGDSVAIAVDLARAASSGVRFFYETVFGTNYALDFKWDGQSRQPVHMNLSSSSC